MVAFTELYIIELKGHDFCSYTSRTENVIEDLVDEFCSDEAYQKEVEENSEIFKLTYRSLPHESLKSES